MTQALHEDGTLFARVMSQITVPYQIDGGLEKNPFLKDLIDLRVRFVLAASKVSADTTAVVEALANLNTVRNKREIQIFLNSNPYFFTSIDRQVYAAITRKH